VPPSLGRSTPDLHELDRQSQPSRGGCYICELQEQPLTFANDLVLLASSQFSAACDQARMKISPKIPRYYSPCKPKAVYAASERNTLQQVEKFKYIVVAFTSAEGGAMRLMDGLLKKTQFFMNFSALWSQNESPAPQSRQFLNRSLF